MVRLIQSRIRLYGITFRLEMTLEIKKIKKK